ncbi:hypothetical protein ACHAXT_011256 [Thalassiosira profunda]
MNHGRGHSSGHRSSERGGGWQSDPSWFQPVDRSRKTNSHQKQTSGFLDVKGCQTVEDLIQLAAGHGTLTTSNLSAFWSRFPHLMHSQGHADQRERPELKGRLESILATTVKAIDRFGAWDVSTTTLGLAKVVSRLQSHRIDRMGARSALFQPLLVKCDVKAKGNTFQLLANRAHSLSKFDARHLSNLAYAYALVEYQPTFKGGTTLFDHIANLASDRMGKFNSQDLANMVWAFAKVKASHPRLFEQVVGTVKERAFSAFKPQELANIVWAFAKAGETCHKLFEHVAGTVLRRDLRTFKPQELANIVWAFAKAGEAHSRLFKKIADCVVGRNLAAFEPQHLSNIVWAFATAGEAHSRLVTKIADCVVGRNLAAFEPQHLSNIVWAFATLSMYHPKLFNKVADAAVAKRSEFNAQNVANTLWAFAVTGGAPEGLFTAFAPVATKLIEDCNAQGLSNIAWAFGVANVSTPRHLFGQRFIDTVCEKERTFNTENLSQLHQWNLWQQELGSHTLLPEALRERCRDAFVSVTILTSSLQTGVVRELSAIGLPTKEEVLMPSGYRLDALVEVFGKRVGIEVDGPTHFIAREPTGSTLLKRRQVDSIDGVQIVSVPYWEWNMLGKHTEKQEYLSSVLGVH